METGLSTRLSPAAGRRFAFTLGAAFLLLGALAWWRGKPTTFVILAAAGGALLLLGVASPGRLGPLYRAWMGLARAISKVTTPIIMGVVFFLVITPIGLLRRLFGRRSLGHLERDGGFWVEPGSGGRSDMNRQF